MLLFDYQRASAPSVELAFQTGGLPLAEMMTSGVILPFASAHRTVLGAVRFEPAVAREKRRLLAAGAARPMRAFTRARQPRRSRRRLRRLLGRGRVLRDTRLHFRNSVVLHRGRAWNVHLRRGLKLCLAVAPRLESRFQDSQPRRISSKSIHRRADGE